MKLTQEQASKLFHTLGPMLGYLHRLNERMDKTGFHPHDPVRISAQKAYDALHSFRMELHYLSCSSGVGRRSEPVE